MKNSIRVRRFFVCLLITMSWSFSVTPMHLPFASSVFAQTPTPVATQCIDTDKDNVCDSEDLCLDDDDRLLGLSCNTNTKQCTMGKNKCEKGKVQCEDDGPKPDKVSCGDGGACKSGECVEPDFEKAMQKVLEKDTRFEQTTPSKANTDKTTIEVTAREKVAIQKPSLGAVNVPADTRIQVSKGEYSDFNSDDLFAVSPLIPSYEESFESLFTALGMDFIAGMHIGGQYGMIFDKPVEVTMEVPDNIQENSSISVYLKHGNESPNTLGLTANPTAICGDDGSATDAASLFPVKTLANGKKGVTFYTCRASGGGGGQGASCTGSGQGTCNVGFTCLTGICQGNVYTLTFNPSGGSVSPTSKSVTYNQAYGSLPPTPTRAGYTFSRWMDSSDGTVTSATIHSVTANDTIYAEWIQNPVCGSANNSARDTPPVNNLCSVGTNNPVTTNTANYTWSCTVPGTSPATCSAPRQYRVTWDGNGGGGHSPQSQTVTYNTAVGGLPIGLSRPGYSFQGWWTTPSVGGSQVTTSTVVTNTVTFYARWNANTCSGTAPATNSVACNDGPPPNTNGQANTLQAGCSTSTACDWECDDFYTKSGNQCLPNPQCGLAHQTPTSTAPTVNRCLYGTSTIVVTNVEDYVWQCYMTNAPTELCYAERQYQVTWNGNGGGGHTPTSQYVIYNDTVGSLPSNPTRVGYTFVNRTTLSNGGTPVTASTVVTANVTFYAQWTANTQRGICMDKHINGTWHTGDGQFLQTWNGSVFSPTEHVSFYSATNTANECEWYCGAGFAVNTSNGDCMPIYNNHTCYGSIPANASSNSSGTYLQTWGTLSYNPTLMQWTHNTTPGECTYACNEGYTWNIGSNSCVQNTYTYTCGSNGNRSQGSTCGTVNYNAGGSYTNGSQVCAVPTPSNTTCVQACNLPWGGTLSHGQSVTAYQTSSVACGSSCASQTRTCTDGTLGGSYTNQSCSVGACSCQGSIPLNAAACNANAPGNNSTSWSQGCANPTACRFECDSGYSWNGATSQCVENGVCGTADTLSYISTATTYSPQTQCAVGSSTNTAFPAQGQTEYWYCNNGGFLSPPCSAYRESPAPSCAGGPSFSTACSNVPLPTIANQTAVLNNSCSNSVACDYTCNAGYYKNGVFTCSPNQCSATPPAANSSACNDGGTPTTNNQAGTLESTCTSTPCDWTCDANYTWNGTQCVQNPVCGTANNTATYNTPTSNLCSVGTESSVTSTVGQYQWTCTNSPATTAPCSAPRQYEVIWTGNGGVGHTPTTQYVTYNNTIGALPSPNPTKALHTFVNRTTLINGGTQVLSNRVITANSTFYAQWTANNYTYTCGADGNRSQGSTCGSINYNAGGTYTNGQQVCALPTPSNTTCVQHCSLPSTLGGGTLLHGQSVTGYLNQNVSCGSSCLSQNRTCSDGVLGGNTSYVYESCSIGACSCIGSIPSNALACNMNAPGNSSTSRTQGCANPTACRFYCESGYTWSGGTNSCVVNPNPINGDCGNANNKSRVNAPTIDRCYAGIPSVVTNNGTTYSWTCAGENGGNPSPQCSATILQMPNIGTITPSQTSILRGRTNGGGTPSSYQWSGGSWINKALNTTHNETSLTCSTNYAGRGVRACDDINDCTTVRILTTTATTACTGFTCQGTAPYNATLCVGDDTGLTQNENRTLVGSCTAPTKCEYECDAGLIFSGGVCMKQASCTSKPINSSRWGTDGSWIQTWSGGAWTPSRSTTHNTSNTANACEFNCNTHYTWNNSACVLNNYTVLFSGNGGVGHTPQSKVVSGNTQLGPLPTNPTYSGYTFVSWFTQPTNGSQINTTTIITGNVTFYAQWTQLPMTGACGTAHNQTYASRVTGYAPDTQCAVGTPTITTFPAVGQTVQWFCEGINGGPISPFDCTASRANTPLTGSCGSANGITYPSTGTNYLPYVQCASGTPSTTDFPAPGTGQSRVCEGLYGGNDSIVCSAQRLQYDGTCDDNIVEYASGAVPGRRCPVGRTLIGNGVPSCYQCRREELGLAQCDVPECGNGLPDPGEECDNGTGNNNNSCTNECRRPYCGDGIFTPSATWVLSGGTTTGLIEMCDPAMTGGLSSLCPSNCLFTGALNVSCNVTFQAYLGYGKSFNEINLPGQLCYPFGIASGVSETDDLRTWDCLSPNEGEDALGCSLPRRHCGDGIVDKWNNENGDPTEECDDNNTNSLDGCSETCTLEPVVTLTPGSGLCTIQSYPQVELGEYLPIWWIGNKTPYVASVCPTTPGGNGGILSSSIKGDIIVYRGTQGGLKEQAGELNNVLITEVNSTSSGMIIDAIKDFNAEGELLIGTNLISPQVISGWVNTGGIEKFGQYLMEMSKVDYTFCSIARNILGTVTGEVNQLIDGEDCDNGYDDNGNGFIDCADLIYCGDADTCTNSLGTGGGTNYIPEIDCSNGISDAGSHPGIDCADPSCRNNANFPNCSDLLFAENCLSPNDEDGDEDANCDDEQCAQTPYCKGLLLSGTLENTIEGCGDYDGNNIAIDNDGDGFANCNDPQCMIVAPQCHPLFGGGSPSICSNNTNDEPKYVGTFTSTSPDLDSYYYGGIFTGLIDALDPQCFLPGVGFTPILPMPTVCTQCSTSPVCQFVSASCYGTNANALYGSRNQTYPLNEALSDCNDNQDNDGDGRVDCRDFDCKTSSVCLGSNPPPSGGTGETICDDLIDNDGDGYVNCADGDCAGAAFCNLGVNEDCFNNGVDDDGDNLADEDDLEDCALFYEFEGGYTPIPTPQQNTKTFTYTGSNGYVCKAGFSVSKGYFVQQGFAFTEEANAGMDSDDFVSIGGVPLVTEGTVLDDGENNVATYSQQSAKKYLFSGFIDEREQKAKNNVNLGNSLFIRERFNKVPNAHIYFWQGKTPNASGFEILAFNKSDRDELLSKGGVAAGKESTTPYTIVLPGSDRPGVKQILDIQGTLTGNALYVSQGDIRFSSSQGSCDSSDTVEGLFIAAGEFTTTPINNKDLKATRRCKGGNLKIRGTLLGSNAGSTLAPLRRSVIDARNPNATFFDNSLVFKAKDLFETCYLPALAMKKASSFMGTYPTLYNGPIGGCNIESLYSGNRDNIITGSRYIRNTFLGIFTDPGNILATALTCDPNAPISPITTAICQKSIDFVYDMMDNVPNANSMFVIPTSLKKLNVNGNLDIIATIADIPNLLVNPQTLLGKMQATSKRFPARWFEGVVIDPPIGGQNYSPVTQPIIFTDDEKPKMMNDVSKVFGEIKDAMIGFGNISKPSGNLSDFNNILQNSSVVSNKMFLIFGPTYRNTMPSTNVSSSQCVDNNSQPICLDGSGIKVNLGGSCYVQPGTTTIHYNNLICHPDFKWLSNNKSQANTQGTTLASNIVDGSSVVISSQPKLWTDLPPGAKDFLNNIVVVPR